MLESHVNSMVVPQILSAVLQVKKYHYHHETIYDDGESKPIQTLVLTCIGNS